MSRKAMNLAQKAIEAHNSGDWDTASELFDEALPALREALAEQPAQPQQEPVATYHGSNDFGHDVIELEKALPIGAKLYTSPPAQRKPLTDEQREEIAKGWRGRNWTVGDIIDAIEAAHGIKGDA